MVWYSSLNVVYSMYFLVLGKWLMLFIIIIININYLATERETCISDCFQIIRTTGFMKGLYGENEMKSDNVKVS